MLLCLEEHLYLAGMLDIRHQGPLQSVMVPATVCLLTWSLGD